MRRAPCGVGAFLLPTALARQQLRETEPQALLTLLTSLGALQPQADRSGLCWFMLRANPPLSPSRASLAWQDHWALRDGNPLKIGPKREIRVYNPAYPRNPKMEIPAEFWRTP